MTHSFLQAIRQWRHSWCAVAGREQPPPDHWEAYHRLYDAIWDMVELQDGFDGPQSGGWDA